jgi:hypothetical protein
MVRHDFSDERGSIQQSLQSPELCDGWGRHVLRGTMLKPLVHRHAHAADAANRRQATAAAAAATCSIGTACYCACVKSALHLLGHPDACPSGTFKRMDRIRRGVGNWLQMRNSFQVQQLHVTAHVLPSTTNGNKRLQMHIHGKSMFDDSMVNALTSQTPAQCERGSAHAPTPLHPAMRVLLQSIGMQLRHWWRLPWWRLQ